MKNIVTIKVSIIVFCLIILCLLIYFGFGMPFPLNGTAGQGYEVYCLNDKSNNATFVQEIVGENIELICEKEKYKNGVNLEFYYPQIRQLDGVENDKINDLIAMSRV